MGEILLNHHQQQQLLSLPPPPLHVEIILTTITPSAYRALLSTSNPSKRVIPIDATWYMPNNPKMLNKNSLKNVFQI